MKTIRTASVCLFLLLCCLALAACGNKGDLVRPGPAPSAQPG